MVPLLPEHLIFIIYIITQKEIQPHGLEILMEKHPVEFPGLLPDNACATLVRNPDQKLLSVRPVSYVFKLYKSVIKIARIDVSGLGLQCQPARIVELDERSLLDIDKAPLPVRSKRRKAEKNEKQTQDEKTHSHILDAVIYNFNTEKIIMLRQRSARK